MLCRAERKRSQRRGIEVADVRLGVVPLARLSCIQSLERSFFLKARLSDITSKVHTYCLGGIFVPFYHLCRFTLSLPRFYCCMQSHRVVQAAAGQALGLRLTRSQSFRIHQAASDIPPACSPSRLHPSSSPTLSSAIVPNALQNFARLGEGTRHKIRFSIFFECLGTDRANFSTVYSCPSRPLEKFPPSSLYSFGLTCKLSYFFFFTVSHPHTFEQLNSLHIIVIDHLLIPSSLCADNHLDVVNLRNTISSAWPPSWRRRRKVYCRQCRCPRGHREEQLPRHRLHPSIHHLYRQHHCNQSSNTRPSPHLATPSSAAMPTTRRHLYRVPPNVMAFPRQHQPRHAPTFITFQAHAQNLLAVQPLLPPLPWSARQQSPAAAILLAPTFPTRHVVNRAVLLLATVRP